MDALPPGITVYNFPAQPVKLDRIGVAYLTVLVTWTTLVVAGMAFLWANRASPILRVRPLGLFITSLTFLHIYWCLAQVVYPVSLSIPIVPAYDIQYFFMGVWFPLGIALFHAANTRFLYVARRQKQFVSPKFKQQTRCNGASSSWYCRLRCMEYSNRIVLYIGIGMVAQVLLTVVMWVLCKKYHPTFGIPGTEIKGTTFPEQLVDLGRGWEWWPTVVWQFVWTWMVAPYLIWKSWGIKDTMGWRFQTIGSCLFSLHATPMFLIALYVPEFAPVNAYFAPSEWFHVATTFFEIFAIFVPCYQVVRHKIICKRAADSNARWETASQTTTLRASTSANELRSPSSMEKGLSMDGLDEELGDRLYTMSALEHVLTSNPGPLQEFSALRDFSGENIAFLTRVGSWKASFPECPTPDQTRALYTQALGIYVDFISPRDAEFPLNISSVDLKHLEDMFEKAARVVCGEARMSPVAPFDFGGGSAPSPRKGSDTTAVSDDEKDGGRLELREVADKIQYAGEIPSAFDASAFDRSQAHVKYLVLTNTWPKFVNENQMRRRSNDSERSNESWGSKTSMQSRLSERVAKMVRSFV